jgi:hypothetical protein
VGKQEQNKTMSSSAQGVPEQFIISKRFGAPKPVNLNEVLEFIRSDPQTRIVNVAGPPNDPERLVAFLSDERVTALRARFGPGLIVEADRMLLDPGISPTFM